MPFGPGLALVKLRLATRMTLREAADALGLSVVQFSALEMGSWTLEAAPDTCEE